DLRRKHFSRFIVLREGLQQLLIAEELFEHLRRNLDEVALGGESRDTCPLCLSAENRVHQMPELVEERHHVAVLKQAWSARIAAWEIADQGSLGHIAPSHAGDDGRCGEPLILALARMHIEMEPADMTALFVDIEHAHRRMPSGRIRPAKLDL